MSRGKILFVLIILITLLYLLVDFCHGATFTKIANETDKKVLCIIKNPNDKYFNPWTATDDYREIDFTYIEPKEIGYLNAKTHKKVRIEVYEVLYENTWPMNLICARDIYIQSETIVIIPICATLSSRRYQK